MEVEMKMVKSLLLGTAAGFVAVAGAQAADMPVKAAVQYVRICNLYGDGFYYLPGTNICVKVGGYVRLEVGYLNGASMTSGPWNTGTLNGPSGAATTVSITGPNGYNDRWDGGDFVMRSRAYISMDTREQTEYGILRSYINIGLNYDSPATGQPAIFSGNRAFLQFAGFTFGLAQSFFDFYSVPISSYNGYFPSSDTGDSGWKVAALTILYGNGITNTVSVEEPRRIGIVDTNSAANPFTLFGAFSGQNGITGGAGNDYAKERFPDIVSNWRIDQAWGSAQIMFAAHDASAAYYMSSSAPAFGGGTCPNAPAAGTPGGVPGSIIGSEICGHPADKLGWAAGAGFKLNVPNSNGSYFQFQYTMTQGASRYQTQTATGNFSQMKGGGIAFGWLTDGIVSNQTGSVDLTKTSGFQAAYDQHWTPRFWTSLYGGYMKVSYDDQANAAICFQQNNIITATGAGVSNPTNCSNNWSFWWVGSRWQYNFTPAFYMGFDVTYSKLNTADAGGTVLFTNGTAVSASASVPQNVYQVQNMDNWGFRVRVHRDILP
jgi:Porin subfamily